VAASFFNVSLYIHYPALKQYKIEINNTLDSHVAMDIKERNKCITRIEKFVKRNKKGQLKTKSAIIKYLDEELSCSLKHHLTIYGSFTRLYGSFTDLFTPFAVIIYFPYHNHALVCSPGIANTIHYLETILKNTFKEKPLRFKYCKNGHVFNGPQIIISMADPHSILLENGKTLVSQYKEY